MNAAPQSRGLIARDAIISYQATDLSHLMDDQELIVGTRDTTRLVNAVERIPEDNGKDSRGVFCAYATGSYLTEHAFDNKAAADEVCARLVECFCTTEDPSTYTNPGVDLSDDWAHWSRQQQRDWHLGSTPGLEYDGNPTTSSGYGWVEMPFEVCKLPIGEGLTLRLGRRHLRQRLD